MIKDEHIRLFKFIDRNGKGILGVVSWLSIELVFFFFWVRIYRTSLYHGLIVKFHENALFLWVIENLFSFSNSITDLLFFIFYRDGNVYSTGP